MSIIREALSGAGQALYLYTGGMSKAGINVSGVWAGTISFAYANIVAVGESAASAGGVVFNPLFVWPFPPGVGVGTGVSSVTANGSWEIQVKNIIAIRAIVSPLTSGAPVVTMSASVDSSYQAAFLTPSSINLSQKVSGGAANVVTQAAQTNRGWRCRTLSISFNVPPAAGVDVQILDGASTVLWEGIVPKQDVSAGGFTWQAPLPLDENVPGLIGGGVFGTVGNALQVNLAAPGGVVVSTVNAEIWPF